LPFKVVTPFEAQRNAIEESLRASGLAWQDICHTVETIQGADAPYIVFTVAQTYSPGFLNDFGSTITAITRFSEGMVVISNKCFLKEDPVASRATKSLLADMARVFTESDAWIDLTALTESTISVKRLFDGPQFQTRNRTKEGFEAQFRGNHLGHFLFTNLIIPRLREATTPEYPARIVIVSSFI